MKQNTAKSILEALHATMARLDALEAKVEKVFPVNVPAPAVEPAPAPAVEPAPAPAVEAPPAPTVEAVPAPAPVVEAAPAPAPVVEAAPAPSAPAPSAYAEEAKEAVKAVLTDCLREQNIGDVVAEPSAKASTALKVIAGVAASAAGLYAGFRIGRLIFRF